MKWNQCQNTNLITTVSNLISPNQFHNLFDQFIVRLNDTKSQFLKSLRARLHETQSEARPV